MPNSEAASQANGCRLLDCLKPEEEEITPIHSKCGTRISKLEVAKDWLRDGTDLMPTCVRGQFVAKKLVRTTDREEWKATCEREFNILSKCESRHIVAAFEAHLNYDENDPNSFSFYLMELGECSLHYVFTTKLSDNEFLFPSGEDEHYYTYEHCKSWLMQVAEGMEFLHSNRILHRDLKSLNVLLFDKRTKCKLCDFDMSRQYDPCGMTPERGTWRWMAPELRRRVGEKTVEYRETADSYSFGILICESLFRQTPFSGYEDSAFGMCDEEIPETPEQEEMAMTIRKQRDGPEVVLRHESATFGNNVDKKLWELIVRLLNWSQPDSRPNFTTVVAIFKELQAKSLSTPLTVSKANAESRTDTGLLAGASVTSFNGGHRVEVAYALTLENDNDSLNDSRRLRIQTVLNTFAGNVRVMAEAANKELSDDQLKCVQVTFELTGEAKNPQLLLRIVGVEKRHVRCVQTHCKDAEHMKWMARLFEHDDDKSLRSLKFTLS